MEPSNQFKDLTWANLTIFEDDLKAVREFDIKTLKYKDLQEVWSQLKIKGVKNAIQEQIIKKLVSLHKINAKYNKLADTSDPAATKRSLSALTGNAFAEGFCNLRMRLNALHLMQENLPTINYFGKVLKKPSIYILQMMRF